MRPIQPGFPSDPRLAAIVAIVLAAAPLFGRGVQASWDRSRQPRIALAAAMDAAATQKVTKAFMKGTKAAAAAQKKVTKTTGAKKCPARIVIPKKVVSHG